MWGELIFIFENSSICEMTEKVIAIVPAYNEEKNIRLVINSLRESVKAGVIADFIVVANGCTDITYRKALTHGAKAINLPVANKGAAFIEGVKWANKNGASTVVTIDADAAEFNPNTLKQLIEPVRNKSTKMSVAGFFYKGENTFVFPEYLSGFRAISMKALRPVLAGNKDWIRSFTLSKYSLEIALNAKIFGIENRKLLSNFDVDEKGKPVLVEKEKELIQKAVLPALFRVRRKIRDAGVRHDITYTHTHFKERAEKLIHANKMRKLSIALRKIKV